MDPLAELLRGGASELGRLALAALAGLRATLRHGLERAAPDDPQRAAVEAALALLDQQPHQTGGDPPIVPTPPTPVSPWAKLLAEWKSRPDAQTLARLAPDAPDLPQRLWLFTARQAPGQASPLRAAWHAASAGSVAPPVPAAPANGLERPTTAIAARMADVVNGLLWFVENDPSLYHLLRSVHRFGLTELAGPQRDRYVAALRTRFDALRQAEQTGDARGVLTGWIDLDEAAHSLVHQPVAHPLSEFGRIAAGGRDVSGEVRELAVRAGLNFHFQLLAGRYADVKGQTDSDVATELGGVPGEVVTCVRMPLKLDDVLQSGRVIYRTR